MTVDEQNMSLTASYVMAHSTNYPNSHEVYNANSSQYSTTKVYLKTYAYGSNYTPATLWQTSAQVDTDGSKTVYSGTQQSATSLQDASGNNVSPENVPYIVLPENNQNNVNLGDLGIVIDVTTGKSVYVIYADRGPSTKIGEASIAVHNALGFTWETSSGTIVGHDALDLVYIMFPGSGAKCGYGYGKPIPTAAQIAANAAPYFNALESSTVTQL